MALPPRVFFTLYETSVRWDCSISDIAGSAAVGKLKIKTGIGLVRCGEAVVAGQVYISSMDLLPLFRRSGTGPAEASAFMIAARPQHRQTSSRKCRTDSRISPTAPRCLTAGPSAGGSHQSGGPCAKKMPDATRVAGRVRQFCDPPGPHQHRAPARVGAGTCWLRHRRPRAGGNPSDGHSAGSFAFANGPAACLSFPGMRRR